MTGIYEWEFDGSVEFAPYNYRKEKYIECEELGREIQDEDSAVAFLKAFDYIEYLSLTCLNEISNWAKLCEYRNKCYSYLKTEKNIYEYIVYPKQYNKWKSRWDELRMKEIVIKEHGFKKDDVRRFINTVANFNKQISVLNDTIKEYGFSFNKYWVKNYRLKHEMRTLVDIPCDKKERLEFVNQHGITDSRIDYR